MAGTFRHVKATFLVTKKEGLSDEEFRKHYTDVHAPMAIEVCKRHGALDYSVVRIYFPLFPLKFGGTNQRLFISSFSD